MSVKRRKGRREGGLPGKGDDGEINKRSGKSTFPAINLYLFWLREEEGWLAHRGCRDEMVSALCSLLTLPTLLDKRAEKTNEGIGPVVTGRVPVCSQLVATRTNNNKKK